MLIREEGSPPLTRWLLLLLMQPRILLATFVVRAHCWLMFNLFSTRTLWSFSTKLLSSRLDPRVTIAWGYSTLGAGFHICLCWTKGTGWNLFSWSSEWWFYFLPYSSFLGSWRPPSQGYCGPKLPLTSTSLTSSSFCASIRSSRHPSLFDSWITCVVKFLSKRSRNILVWFCLAMLSFQQCQGDECPHENHGNVRLLPIAWRRPQLLIPYWEWPMMICLTIPKPSALIWLIIHHKRGLHASQLVSHIQDDFLFLHSQPVISKCFSIAGLQLREWGCNPVICNSSRSFPRLCALMYRHFKGTPKCADSPGREREPFSQGCCSSTSLFPCPCFWWSHILVLLIAISLLFTPPLPYPLLGIVEKRISKDLACPLWDEFWLV